MVSATGGSKAAGAATREAHGLNIRREREREKERPEQSFLQFSKNNAKSVSQSPAASILFVQLNVLYS